MTRYVALLRGINVGGRNPIKMTALRTCLEQGCGDHVALRTGQLDHRPIASGDPLGRDKLTDVPEAPPVERRQLPLRQGRALHGRTTSNYRAAS
jgi:hypothetical protein